MMPSPWTEPVVRLRDRVCRRRTDPPHRSQLHELVRAPGTPGHPGRQSSSGAELLRTHSSPASYSHKIGSSVRQDVSSHLDGQSAEWADCWRETTVRMCGIV